MRYNTQQEIKMSQELLLDDDVSRLFTRRSSHYNNVRPFRRRQQQPETHHDTCQQNQQHGSRLSLSSANAAQLAKMCQLELVKLSSHHNTTSTKCKRYSIKITTTNNVKKQSFYRPPALSFVLLLLSLSLSLILITITNLTHHMVESSPQQTTVIQHQQHQQQQAFTSPIHTTSAKARYKTMYACEDTQLTMFCEPGSKINLIRANFGRFSITQCNEQGQLDLSTDCMSPITFRIMQERCQDKPKCSVNATSSLFGDKCPKTRKYLEVHFQCTQIEPDVVYLPSNGAQSVQLLNNNNNNNNINNLPSTLFTATSSTGSLKPPNNPTYSPPMRPVSSSSSSLATPTTATTAPVTHHLQSSPYHRLNEEQQPPSNAQQTPSAISSVVVTPVINSPVMSAPSELSDLSLNSQREIIMSMRHNHIENMSRPRCFQWDSIQNQWTERGTRIIETNLTNTICAFNEVSSYVLVMDYSGPMQTTPIVQNKSNQQPTQTATLPLSTSTLPNNQLPEFLNSQPVPIDTLLQPSATLTSVDINKVVLQPNTSANQQLQQQQQQQQQSTATKLFSLFGYLLAIVFVAIALLTLTFVATSTMKSSAGAAFKSLGNFPPFNHSSKYKHRRQDVGLTVGQAASSLHLNKDLLVINNANGHQFIYAPASTTKISSSSSTHILATGVGNNNNMSANQQTAGTLHRLQQHQQQQMLYSGNGATLSSLSATGAQSNNYYYGLMGLNPLFQQQQQQQHHHHQQQQQQQFGQHLNQQPQIAHQQAQNYNHQANKSTVSGDSVANSVSTASAASSSSSSGIESGSTSMQQQQQHQHPQTQQACLLSTNANMINDYNLMSHQQQQQPTLTLNAHYSTSGGAGLQSINMMASVQQQQQQHSVHSRQASNQMRDHIYECVDDDKPYMARLLMPTNNVVGDQFGTLGHHTNQQYQQQTMASAASNNVRSMTLSSRLLQDVFQQQQQQQQQTYNNRTHQRSNNNNNNFPASIVRDNQAAKTNIICSKLAQVTPQRATEVGKSSFQHDVMTIYNSNKNETTTAAIAATSGTTTNACYGQRLNSNNNMALNNQSKLSTDC